jgi:hypothetical protein
MRAGSRRGRADRQNGLHWRQPVHPGRPRTIHLRWRQPVHPGRLRTIATIALFEASRPGRRRSRAARWRWARLRPWRVLGGLCVNPGASRHGDVRGPPRTPLAPERDPGSKRLRSRRGRQGHAEAAVRPQRAPERRAVRVVRAEANGPGRGGEAHAVRSPRGDTRRKPARTGKIDRTASTGVNRYIPDGRGTHGQAPPNVRLPNPSRLECASEPLPSPSPRPAPSKVPVLSWTHPPAEAELHFRRGLGRETGHSGRLGSQRHPMPAPQMRAGRPPPRIRRR